MVPPKLRPVYFANKYKCFHCSGSVTNKLEMAMMCAEIQYGELIYL